MGSNSNETNNFSILQRYDEDQESNEVFIQPKSKDLAVMVMERIKKGKTPNARIIIDREHFDVHLIVLQVWSQYFDVAQPEEDPHLSHLRVYKLPSEKVSMWAFKKLYKWMINSSGPERLRVIEMLDAANYLQVQKYIDQCFQIINDPSIITEVQAFLLYQEARDRNMEDIVGICLPRISLFFLTLVSSSDFVMMPVNDVVALLASDFIFIHSEVEVFFAGVRWLNHDWNGRKEFALVIMETVRFQLMPGNILSEISESWNEVEVQNVTNQPEISKLISDACIYFALKTTMGNVTREEFEKNLEQISMKIPKPRHYEQTRDVKHVGSYYKFLRYLVKLGSKPPKFYEHIKSEPPSEDENVDATYTLIDVAGQLVRPTANCQQQLHIKNEPPSEDENVDATYTLIDVAGQLVRPTAAASSLITASETALPTEEAMTIVSALTSAMTPLLLSDSD